MATQAAVLQKTRMGVQSGLGNAAAANRRFPSLMSAGWFVPEVTTYGSQGDVVDSTAVLNKEWSEFEFEGGGTYNEYAYLWTLALGQAVGGGPSGSIWTWHPPVDDNETVVFFTLEHGMDDTCGKTPDATGKSLTLNWTRGELKASGSGFGRIYSAAATPTSSPTRIGNVPTAANQTQILIGSSYPATTVLRNVYSWDFSITNIRDMVWTMDKDNPSWKKTVKLKPAISLKIKLERDADSDTFLTQMRGNTTKFMQVLCVGPTGYGMTINLPFVATMTAKPAGAAGVYASEWDIKPMADSSFQAATSNAWMEVILQNTLGAL